MYKNTITMTFLQYYEEVKKLKAAMVIIVDVISLDYCTDASTSFCCWSSQVELIITCVSVKCKQWILSLWVHLQKPFLHHLNDWFVNGDNMEKCCHYYSEPKMKMSLILCRSSSIIVWNRTSVFNHSTHSRSCILMFAWLYILFI